MDFGHGVRNELLNLNTSIIISKGTGVEIKVNDLLFLYNRFFYFLSL